MANDKYGDFEPGKVRTEKKDQPKIRLLRLWQRRSKNNEVWFSGFLGDSRIAILRDHWASKGDLPDGCEAIWQVILEQTEDRRASLDNASTSRPSNGTAQTNSATEPTSRRAEGPKVEELLNDEVPF